MSLTASQPLDTYLERLKYSVCTLNYIQPSKTSEMNPAPTNQGFFPFVTSLANNVKLKCVSSIFFLAYGTFPTVTAFLKPHRASLFTFLCIWSTVESGVTLKISEEGGVSLACLKQVDFIYSVSLF